MLGAGHAEDYTDGAAETVDEQYVAGYDDVAVHRVMLADAPRMAFYASAIAAAGVSGQVVVDCGAGSGVLSLLALRCGARAVTAIEASPGISDMIATTLRRNAASIARTVRESSNGSGPSAAAVSADDIERRLSVHFGLAEDFPAADFIRDVAVAAAGSSSTTVFLVSEWMGFFLLHEAMLNSVVLLRDRLRAAASANRGAAAAPVDVRLIPDTAAIWCAPFDLSRHRAAANRGAWQFLGFDFSALGDAETASVFSTDRNPVIAVVRPESLLCRPQRAVSLDLSSITVAELERVCFDVRFAFPHAAAGAAVASAADAAVEPATLHGFVLWFSVAARAADGAGGGVELSTSPMDEPTHWKQTVVMLSDEGVPVADLDGGAVTAKFALTRHERCYEIDVELE
jgi:hypothetical protein